MIITKHKQLVICDLKMFQNTMPNEYCFLFVVPALKGKDYGKTKMNYPDYAQTSSGLQYKVTRVYSIITNFLSFLYYSTHLCSIIFCNLENQTMQDLRTGNGPIPKPGDIVVVCQPFCTSPLMF